MRNHKTPINIKFVLTVFLAGFLFLTGTHNNVLCQDKTGYAPVNGMEMYYEIHGEGEPLIMIHGAFMTLDMFGELLPVLAENRKVIAVELQGHGRTKDIDQPIRYKSLAQDIIALIDHLELDKPDVLGYSLGGGTALQAGIQAPEKINKLLLISMAYQHEGWRTELIESMKEMNVEQLEGTPMHQAYMNTAPNPEDWPILFDKLIELDTEHHYDWTNEVQQLEIPIQIIAGDSDSVILQHVLDMFVHMGGDVDGMAHGMPNVQLAVLPGTTHVSAITKTDLLIPMITEFLEGSEDPVNEEFSVE